MIFAYVCLFVCFLPKLRSIDAPLTERRKISSHRLQWSVPTSLFRRRRVKVSGVENILGGSLILKTRWWSILEATLDHDCKKIFTGPLWFHNRSKPSLGSKYTGLDRIDAPGDWGLHNAMSIIRSFSWILVSTHDIPTRFIMKTSDVENFLVMKTSKR